MKSATFVHQQKEAKLGKTAAKVKSAIDAKTLT